VGVGLATLAIFWAIRFAVRRLEITIFARIAETFASRFSAGEDAINRMFEFVVDGAFRILRISPPEKFERQNLSFAERLLEEKANVVAQNYLKKLQSSSIAAGLAFLVIGVVIWRIGDLVGCGALIFLTACLLANILITRYRVGRGLFGSTPQEAYELISFMIEQTDVKGRPPGSRVSLPYSEAAESREGNVFDGVTSGASR
jgi:hypothetical protein